MDTLKSDIESRFLEQTKMWDTIDTVAVIKPILLRVRWILDDEKTKELSKEILTLSYIIDTIFSSKLTKEESIFLEGFSEWNDNNKLYHHTPIIWIFYKWEPIFLNRNYVEALWAENIEILKQHINNWIALEKYYTQESFLLAKEAVSLLKKWEWYKNLELETKDWKLISWNSFWSNTWLEVRVWSNTWLEMRVWQDITHWTFQRKEQDTLDNWLSLDSINTINTFLIRVNQIITPEEINKLKIFAMFCEILEKIWKDWQYLMNITVDEKDWKNRDFIFNTNYLNALWFTLEEINFLINNNLLYDKIYTEEELFLIKWLFKVLKDNWYYIEDFRLRDKNWELKTFSWFRQLIEDKDFWLNRTIWIWTWAKSIDIANLEDLMKSLFK